jgi:hypothetical protein
VFAIRGVGVGVQVNTAGAGMFRHAETFWRSRLMPARGGGRGLRVLLDRRAARQR